MTVEAKIIADSVSPSKKEAQASGAKRYLGGECKHHPGQRVRWTSNGTCIDCTLKQATKWRKENGNKLKQSRTKWDRNNPEKAMLQRARRRAKDLGLEFDLKPEDINIPNVCPVFGIPLERVSDNQDSAPSLDRIKNDIGYVKGNVVVVSFKANRIKSNASFDDLEKVVGYYAQYFS